MGLLDAFKDPKDKPKAIAMTVAIGAAICGAVYYFWVNGKEVKADIKQAAQGVTSVVHRIENRASVAYKRAFDKLVPVKDRVQAFKEQNLERFVQAKKRIIDERHSKTFSHENLTAINQLALEISENDVRKILKQNREERRKLIEHSKDKYEEVVIEGLKDIEVLFNENLNAILSECECSRDKYEASIVEHVQKDQSVALFGSQLLDQLVARLPAINDPANPSTEFTSEIYGFMAEEYRNIKYLPLRKEHWVDTKESMVFDRLHEKYGLEEEDLLKLRHKFETSEVMVAQEQYVKLLSDDESANGNFPDKRKK